MNKYINRDQNNVMNTTDVVHQLSSNESVLGTAVFVAHTTLVGPPLTTNFPQGELSLNLLTRIFTGWQLRGLY